MESLRDFELSAPALAVHAASSSSGLGLLAVGRSWVQFEGWVLKEGGMAGGWHPRFFVVSGDRLEYFKEEKLRIEVKPGETASTLLSSNGFELDHTNVLSAINQPPPKHMLNEGDVIIGINGESVVNRRVDQALAAAPPGAVSFTVLRPKGRVALHGASVAPAGPRKAGGHVLTVNVSDSSSRRSRYNLVCADEKLCAGWIASIKEAIAASGMEEIKTALSQALQLQALQQQSSAPLAAPATSVARNSRSWVSSASAPFEAENTNSDRSFEV